MKKRASNRQIKEMLQSERSCRRVVALLMRYHQAASSKGQATEIEEFRRRVVEAAKLVQWMEAECAKAIEKVRAGS